LTCQHFALRKGKKMIENEFEWLPLSLVEKFIPLMERYNVSEVARGAKPSAQTREGFIEAYDAVNGLKSKMRKRETGFSDQTWDERRHAFVSRHMAQIEYRGEPLYQDNGDPTRHHLSLIAWAYSPDEEGIKEYAKEYRLNPKKKKKRKNGYKAAIKGPIALEEDGQLSLLYRNPKKGSKLVVQAILIDKSLYDIEEAIEWIESSDFDLKKIDLGLESSQYFRFRQRDPDKMKKSSFRTKELTDGIKAIFAVPKN
jgi:hypothetical protein